MKTGGGADGACETAGLRQAAARVRDAEPGRVLDERCKELGDELERVSGSGTGDGLELKEASRVLGALLADVDYAACAKVLGASIGRAYIKHENWALDALFGEIAKRVNERKRTLVMLEAVRVSLLCAYGQAGDLGITLRLVLSSCYDALTSVACSNALKELPRRMKKAGAEDTICAGRSRIANVARLWRLIYDMCDVPSDAEARRVLEQYNRLSALLPNRQLERSKARISQLIQNVARVHVMHENYEDVHIVAAESNMRIRYWLDVIYNQHGINSNLCSLDSPPKSAYQKPSLEWANLVVGVRYLVLELDGFRSLERLAYRQIVRRVNVENPEAVYNILDRSWEIERAVKLLRNVSGAHIDWTFNQVKAAVDGVGLAAIVGHARRVLLFEDAMYRAISHKRHRYHRCDPRGHEPINHEALGGEQGRLEEIRERYRRVDLSLNTKSADEWNAIYESYLCICMTYGKYLERLRNSDGTVDAVMLATSEIYNMKYLFLDMCNIIKKLKPSLTKPFEPEFFSRERGYCRLRNYYSAHTRVNKIRDLRQILKKEKNLLSHIPYDIEEVGQIMEILEKKFRERPTYEIAHMTGSQIRQIEEGLEALKESTNADFYNEFLDPDEEKKRRAAKRLYAQVLKSGKGEQGMPGAPRDAGGGGAEPPSALGEAEDAIRGIGPERCPKEWLEDMACGDFGGALARMGAYLALSGNDVDAVPGCPAGGGGRPDMVAGRGNGRCWLAVCALDNVPRMLKRGGRARGAGDAHATGAGRAISGDIVGACHARLARMDGWRGQAAMVVVDPDGAIRDHGGLEGALEAIGREMPWVGAVAVVSAGRCEVRGVPRSKNPLREEVRGMLRALGASMRAGEARE